MTEQVYVVHKVTIREKRVWLTVTVDGTPEQAYSNVISLPRDFSFVPKKVIITDV